MSACVELHTAVPVLERIAMESAASAHELREMNARFEAERVERSALFPAVTSEQRDSGVFTTMHRTISGSTVEDRCGDHHADRTPSENGQS